MKAVVTSKFWFLFVAIPIMTWQLVFFLSLTILCAHSEELKDEDIPYSKLGLIN